MQKYGRRKVVHQINGWISYIPQIHDQEKSLDKLKKIECETLKYGLKFVHII